MLQAQRDAPTLLARVFHAVPRSLRWSTALLALALPILTYTHGHAFKQTVKRQLSLWDIAAAQPLLEDPLTAEEGVHLLLQALVRTPEEPQVLRALAQLTALGGLPAHSRFFYEHLSRITALTREDEFTRARVHAALNDHSGAQIILQRLEDSSPADSDLLRTQAEITAQSGKDAATRLALEKALRASPGDKNTLFDLAKSRAQSPEEAQQHTGITEMLDLFEKSLTERDPARRTQAFWTLASLDITDPAQRTRFISLIGRQPVKGLERRVIQRFLQASLDTTDPDRTQLRDWLRRLIAEESGTGAGERLIIAKILQQHGEHNLVLEWITFEQGLGETGLCTTRIDSLLALRLWNQALLMVEDRATPLVRPLQAILQAQIEMLATGGQTAKSTELLGIALQEARDKGEQGNFIAIGRLAAAYGHPRTAIEAYGQALQPQFPVVGQLVEPLLEVGRRSGASAGDILRILQQRSRDEFWNQELSHHVEYLSLLAGEGIELIQTRHQSIPADAVDTAHRALFHALACCRLADDAALATSIRRLPAAHAWTRPEQAVLHHLTGMAPPPADTPLLAEERRFLFAPPP